MWNSLLGALAIEGMVLLGLILVPGAPKLIDAISDRIRHGAHYPVEHEGNEAVDDEEREPAAPVASAKPGKAAA
ncbi:hypothetical protein [Actinokineospora iranica]|uniref:Uncharacterized protein n=1 Tax=Actinokineospora iranica TaxID=1271860 RepID=A0A1G6VQQ1_9PSEU|nr:hypothetical protein [Actinokineospora iranica]SDD55990.1 hypothetical protein SAMN05216174_11348 [Actinokineospora iranica]